MFNTIQGSFKETSFIWNIKTYPDTFQTPSGETTEAIKALQQPNIFFLGFCLARTGHLLI